MRREIGYNEKYDRERREKAQQIVDGMTQQEYESYRRYAFLIVPEHHWRHGDWFVSGILITPKLQVRDKIAEVCRAYDDMMRLTIDDDELGALDPNYMQWIAEDPTLRGHWYVPIRINRGPDNDEPAFQTDGLGFIPIDILPPISMREWSTDFEAEAATKYDIHPNMPILPVWTQGYVKIDRLLVGWYIEDVGTKIDMRMSWESLPISTDVAALIPDDELLHYTDMAGSATKVTSIYRASSNGDDPDEGVKKYVVHLDSGEYAVFTGDITKPEDLELLGLWPRSTKHRGIYPIRQEAVNAANMDHVERQARFRELIKEADLTVVMEDVLMRSVDQYLDAGKTPTIWVPGVNDPSTEEK